MDGKKISKCLEGVNPSSREIQGSINERRHEAGQQKKGPNQGSGGRASPPNPDGTPKAWAKRFRRNKHGMNEKWTGVLVNREEERQEQVKYDDVVAGMHADERLHSSRKGRAACTPALTPTCK